MKDKPNESENSIDFSKLNVEALFTSLAYVIGEREGVEVTFTIKKKKDIEKEKKDEE